VTGGYVVSNEANAEQRQFWNSAFGEKWVAYQDDLETLHGPMNEPLLARANIGDGMRVLDVGCGSGSVARRAAEMAGPDGAVTAVDISEVLLGTAMSATARPDGAPIEYLLADAQTHDFEPASFDRVISRMGVMFFADPVAAFANLLRAARPGAGFSAIVWRSGEANPWFRIPTQAAVAVLGPIDSDPKAPGPLAFADVDRAMSLLAAAGWKDVSADPLAVTLETRGSAQEAAESVGSLGPAARIMKAKGATEAQAERIVAAIAEGFFRFETAHGLRVPVTMTLLAARAP
jgi:SAM-dependent methyltransferase